MTEEIDSIAPVGASASLGLSGARVDVTLAPQPAQPVRAPRRSAQTAAAGAASATSGTSSAPSAPPQQIGPLEDSVKQINASLAAYNRILQLRVDASTGITIAEIKNSATGQVLQQIPSADVVHLAEMLSAWAHGKNILVDLIA